MLGIIEISCVHIVQVSMENNCDFGRIFVRYILGLIRFRNSYSCVSGAPARLRQVRLMDFLSTAEIIAISPLRRASNFLCEVSESAK